MAFVYILKSEINNRFYIGSTADYKKRVKKHNSGSVRSTKAYRPWKIVFCEEFDTITKARKRESQIKSWKSKKAIKKLIEAPSSNG